MAKTAAATPAAPTWVEADARTRDAAKWLIGALGAVAVAVFGAGPIVSGVKLSWTNQWPQLLIAAGFGIVGLGSIVLLVVAVGKMLVPVVTSSALLAPDTITLAEHSQPGDLLPKGIHKVKDLLAAIETTANLVESLGDTAHHYRDTNAPADADRVDQQREQLGRYLSKLQAYALQLQEYDAFIRIRDGFLRPYGRGWLLYALVLGAAIGSLGFILAISSKPDAAPKADSPTLATIQVIPTSNSSVSLWSQLKLAQCGDGNELGPVPVLISAEQGAGKYTVGTIPKVGCSARTFDVDSTLAIVAKPKAKTITIKVKR